MDGDVRALRGAFHVLCGSPECDPGAHLGHTVLVQASRFTPIDGCIVLVPAAWSGV